MKLNKKIADLQQQIKMQNTLIYINYAEQQKRIAELERKLNKVFKVCAPGFVDDETIKQL